MFNVHIQGIFDSNYTNRSGQVRSECLTCTFRGYSIAIILIGQVRSGQVRVVNMHIQGILDSSYTNRSGQVRSGQSV